MHFGATHAPPRPTWTPLALALGLHLLLVLAWRWQAQVVPSAALPERLIELVPVRPPQPSARPAPAPLPTPLPGPRKPVAAPVAPAPAPAPVETAPAEQPVGAEASPAPAQTANDAPLTLEGEDLLAAGKRSAAAFDREQRKGKSGVPLEADTPWSRFRAGLAAAHVDSSLSMRLEKYESPDGVVIYRTTQGGKQTCRMSGAVVFGPGRAGGGSAAGNVDCPKGVRWERL